MGSYLSQNDAKKAASPEKRPMKVLIAGGGIVGLTIAQGCRENGIPYELFERDTEGRYHPFNGFLGNQPILIRIYLPGSRSQGWALTLHWCLNSLERTIGEDRKAKLPSVSTDNQTFYVS